MGVWLQKKDTRLISQAVAAILMNCSQQFISKMKALGKLGDRAHELIPVELIEKFLIKAITEEEIELATNICRAERLFKSYRIKEGLD